MFVNLSRQILFHSSFPFVGLLLLFASTVLHHIMSCIHCFPYNMLFLATSHSFARIDIYVYFYSICRNLPCRKKFSSKAVRSFVPLIPPTPFDSRVFINWTPKSLTERPKMLRAQREISCALFGFYGLYLCTQNG